MTAPTDATWPGGYGGFCQIHRLSLPCPSCTSAVPIQPPPPVFIPGGSPVPPVSYPPQPAAPAPNPDPFMYHTPDVVLNTEALNRLAAAIEKLCKGLFP